jgi:hypothetical protein
MHRLPGHPIPAGHLSHRRALFQDFHHGPIPLLHNTQLHQHTRPPSLRPVVDHSEAPGTPGNQQPRKPVRGVAHLPELLSPSYRNRVRNLSPRNRNRCVKHQPEPHTGLRHWCPSDCPSGAAPSLVLISNFASELGWSYGDSNPRPLACHPAAAHPPAFIPAGHRPRTCPMVCLRPSRLLYSAAVCIPLCLRLTGSRPTSISTGPG